MITDRYYLNKFPKAVEFSSRVLSMFEDASGGKLKDDVSMRAKYLYLRGLAQLSNTTNTAHLKVAPQAGTQAGGQARHLRHPGGVVRPAMHDQAWIRSG